MGLGQPVAEKSLTQRIAPSLDASHEPVIEQLRGILQQHCGDKSTAVSPDIEQLVSCLMNYFLQVQAILSLACQTQQHINSLLGRAEPEQAFDAADIDIHNLLQARETRKIPYLLDELEEVFGIRIAITQEGIEIKELKPVSC